jgi:hypothetical protein
LNGLKTENIVNEKRAMTLSLPTQQKNEQGLELHAALQK